MKLRVQCVKEPYNTNGQKNSKNKKGDNAGKDIPVLVADGHNIYIPTYQLDQVREIRANAEMVQAINDGKCGYKTREWIDEKHGNKLRYSGNFIDI